jgi:ArsR family transcriptional regulator
MNIKDVAKICKALGTENRLQIVQMLIDGELCACKILETLDITQPTLSHHMKILLECDLIHARKEGKWTYYSLNCGILSAYREFIDSLTCCDRKDDARNCCCK